MSEIVEHRTDQVDQDIEKPEDYQAVYERARTASEKLAETHRALVKAVKIAGATGHPHADGEYPSPNSRISYPGFGEVHVRYREQNPEGGETMYDLGALFHHSEATTAALESVIVQQMDAEGHVTSEREITGAEAMEVAAEKGAFAAQELGDAAVARVEKLVADYRGETLAEAPHA